MILRSPILLPIPEELKTKRLYMRCVRPGDGKLIYEAAKSSWRLLQRWMHWAYGKPSERRFEEYARRTYAQWLLREELQFLIFKKKSKKIIGAASIHNIYWPVPRVEVGYWLRTNAQGHGYAQEAVLELCKIAFDVLKAKRIEIHCDADNAASQKLAIALGFLKEAELHCHGLKTTTDGLQPRHTVIYGCTSVKQLSTSKDHKRRSSSRAGSRKNSR